MIVISNKQRDELVRYIDLLCESLQGNSNKVYNTKRLALRLKRSLLSKQPIAAEELRHTKEFCHPE